MGQESRQKVAVYVTGSSDKGTDEFVGAYLVDAIVRSSGYTAVERTSDFLKELNKEQGYQQSGNVDDNQISRLGKQFGVQLVCIAKVGNMGNKQFLSARLIDVETATVKNSTKPFTFSSGGEEKICEAVVNQLLGTQGISTVQQTETELVSAASLLREGRIRQAGGAYYFEGSKDRMTQKEYQDYLENNCLEAFDRFQKGANQAKWGKRFLWGGAGLVVAGGVLSLTDVDEYGYSNNSDLYGMVVVLGAASAITSIPLFIIGSNNKKASVEIYNRNCRSTTPKVSLNFNVKNNG
ncbi:hypothetical protein AGMMS49965_08830 [Bacteroidia bacterium]|nr:hypothetical protein AGMMS49965_08830 [Bacteroidia bacterium]